MSHCIFGSDQETEVDIAGVIKKHRGVHLSHELAQIALPLTGADPEAKALGLPQDYAARKNLPIFTGAVMYFPLALAAVAHCSKIGNDQHNPGEPLHWDRSKSMNQHDTLVRHLVEAGTFDSDGVRHSAKAAWRALAALQLEIEADGGRIHKAAELPELPELPELRTIKAIKDSSK